MIEAVAREHVSVFHGLNAVVVARKDAEGELAFMVGGHTSAGAMHLIAIDLERHALHRDARALVCHVARELHAVFHLDHAVLYHVVAGGSAEADGQGLLIHDAHDTQLIAGLAAVDVGQVAQAEVAALVGSGTYLLFVYGGHNLLARYASAVEEAQVALHRGRLIAHAIDLLGLVIVIAFAAGHAAHLIYVLVYGRGLLVLILHLGDLALQQFPAAVLFRVRGRLVLTPHLVVIYRLVGLVGPGEQGRGGQGLHLKRFLVDMAQVLVVESGKFWLRHHVGLLVEVHEGHHVAVTILRPLVAQQGDNLVSSLARHVTEA